MARYYQVHGEIMSAMIEAATKAAKEGNSMTIFTTRGGPDFFLVGPTTDTPDLVEGGLVALYSMQAHPALSGWCRAAFDDSMVCWADREEEAK